jgi:pimeloyl-ACP methyl ester carboxylesterase
MHLTPCESNGREHMDIIVGQEEGSTPPSGHEVIARGIPRAQLVVVEKASHTVPEEQADEFNRLTLEFLAKHVYP